MDERPELRQPILITAFSGWNDAAEGGNLRRADYSAAAAGRPFRRH